MEPLLKPNSHCIPEKQKPEVNVRGCSWEPVLGDSMNCFVHRSQTVTRGGAAATGRLLHRASGSNACRSRTHYLFDLCSSGLVLSWFADKSLDRLAS